METTRERMQHSYDRLKQYKGAGYSGMKVGGTHRWWYDRGEWRERKLTPDEWDIYYRTKKWPRSVIYRADPK